MNGQSESSVAELRPPQPKLLKPEIIDLGIAALHNMPCAVYTEQHAVLDMKRGVFTPSWKAQAEGWVLVQTKSRFQRWLIANFF